MLLDQAPRRQQLADVLLDRRKMQFVQLHHDFRHAEKPDHCRHVRRSGGEMNGTEGEARLCCQRIETYHAEQDAQCPGEYALGHHSAGQAADQKESPDGEHHIIPRREEQRQVGQHRRADGQAQHSDQAAENPHDRRQSDGLPGLTHLGQRVTIQSRRDRRGRAGHIDQDRAARAPINAAVINTCDQRQGLVDPPLESEGNQDRDGHGDRQTGNRTYVDAEKDPGSGQEHQVGIEKTHPEI